MELSKRKTLRLEPIPGGVRVRDITEDYLTSLFWAGKLSEIAYSCGVSLQKDLWMASILGLKAKNMEPSSRSGNHGNLPGSLLALSRINRSMKAIHAAYGSKGTATVMAAAQDQPVLDVPLLESALLCLATSRPRRPRPLEEIRKLLRGG